MLPPFDTAPRGTLWVCGVCRTSGHVRSCLEGCALCAEYSILVESGSIKYGAAGKVIDCTSVAVGEMRSRRG